MFRFRASASVNGKHRWYQWQSDPLGFPTGAIIFIVVFFTLCGVAVCDQVHRRRDCLDSRCRTGKPVVIESQCLCVEKPE